VSWLDSRLDVWFLFVSHSNQSYGSLRNKPTLRLLEARSAGISVQREHRFQEAGRIPLLTFARESETPKCRLVLVTTVARSSSEGGLFASHCSTGLLRLMT